MVKLIAKSAAEGLLPIEGDGALAAEMPFETLTSLAPLTARGEAGLAVALKDLHGLALPKAGRFSGKAGARCAWFGAAHYLLMGPPPEPGLEDHAARTDQSDAWCHVALTGLRAAETLSYLTPLDLRDAHFKRGHAARAQIGHMNGLILRSGAQSYELLVFRSMAATLVHELSEAMRALP
ncbi:MAG: sarcosine oxidase subunit gamma [Pseudomonadota bacterium]